MKKAIFAGIAVAMLTACSNDEVVLENNDANAIRFSVTTERNSRAADVFCNNHKFGAFNVFATIDGSTFISSATVATENNGATWNSDKTYYWPTTDAVTFYGYVNGSLDVNNPAAPQFTEFSPSPIVADQVDLLYAVKTQAKAAGTQVNMNFRHALSQIVFNARNDNENLRVAVKGVSIVNVKGTGTYKINGADTDGNIDHEYGSGAFQTAGRGEWSFAETTEATTQYAVSFNPVTVEGNKTTVNLTDWSNHSAAGAATAATAADKALAMLLIPQETEEYNIAEADTEKDSEGSYIRNGSYFLVDCEISYVDKDEDGTEHVSVIWDKGNVMIPVKFNWEEGKKYLYTFVFGNGNGGYDPDPEDPTPDPVLVPITFSVSIDEFYNVDGGVIETGKTE